MGSDPLAVLVVDENEIAQDALAEALAPYVGITKSGGLVLTERVTELTAASRMLVVLLATWAANLLGYRARPGAPPAELVDLSGLPAGTVRPKLSELSKRGLVVKRGAEYAIALSSVRLALAAVAAGRRIHSHRKAG